MRRSSASRSGRSCCRSGRSTAGGRRTTELWGRYRSAIVPQDPTKTELAQRGYAAWNADDLEALLSICHDEVEYHTSGVFPGLEPVYPGKEGVRRWWETFHEPWSEIKVIPERIAEWRDGVAVLIRFEWTGRQGIETT